MYHTEWHVLPQWVGVRPALVCLASFQHCGKLQKKTQLLGYELGQYSLTEGS